MEINRFNEEITIKFTLPILLKQSALIQKALIPLIGMNKFDIIEALDICKSKTSLVKIYKLVLEVPESINLIIDYDVLLELLVICKTQKQFELIVKQTNHCYIKPSHLEEVDEESRMKYYLKFKQIVLNMRKRKLNFIPYGYSFITFDTENAIIHDLLMEHVYLVLDDELPEVELPSMQRLVCMPLEDGRELREKTVIKRDEQEKKRYLKYTRLMCEMNEIWKKR